eukprot:scaffold103484_cov63-Phaeocystis_antarctica.AAC.1
MGCGVDDVAGDVGQRLADGGEARGQFWVVDGELSEGLARHLDVLHRRWDPCKCHHRWHITKVRDILGRAKREKLSRVGEQLAGTAQHAKAHEQLGNERVKGVTSRQPKDPVVCGRVLRSDAVEETNYHAVGQKHALRLAG